MIRALVGASALVVLVLLVRAYMRKLGESPAPTAAPPPPTLGAVGGKSIVPGLLVSPLRTTRPQGIELRGVPSGLVIGSLRPTVDPRLANARAIAEEAQRRWRILGFAADPKRRAFLTDAAQVAFAAATASSFEAVRPWIQRMSDRAIGLGWTAGGGHELIEQLVALG